MGFTMTGKFILKSQIHGYRKSISTIDRTVQLLEVLTPKVFSDIEIHELNRDLKNGFCFEFGNYQVSMEG